MKLSALRKFIIDVIRESRVEIVKKPYRSGFHALITQEQRVVEGRPTIWARQAQR
jgi:hypothetical protein